MALVCMLMFACTHTPLCPPPQVEAELSGTSWRSFTDGERDHHCRSRTKVIIEEWESDHVRDFPSPFADIPANEDGSGEDASEQDEDMDE